MVGRGFREELPGPLGVLRVGPGAPDEPEFSIEAIAAPATVSVIVTSDGRPLVDHEVQLVHRDRKEVLRVAARKRTDAAGRCELGQVTAREYRLRVRPAGGRKWRTLKRSVRLSAGKPESVVAQLPAR